MEGASTCIWILYVYTAESMLLIDCMKDELCCEKVVCCEVLLSSM